MGAILHGLPDCAHLSQRKTFSATWGKLELWLANREASSVLVRLKRNRSSDEAYMRIALRLARRGHGMTSPNPMVGAVLVKGGRIIGRGWHHRAGGPHAEIEALLDARRRKHDPKRATLFVTLEPCSTHGRTPPCTEAIIAAGIRRVVVGAIDPNPAHAGHGLKLLTRAGIEVNSGLLVAESTRLNEGFNHWIVTGTPFVTVKAAMTLDGKIAAANGESKWITGGESRAWGMRLRLGSDAILVGVNSVLADNPSLTYRGPPLPGPAENCSPGLRPQPQGGAGARLDSLVKSCRRIVLDSRARTPLHARLVTDKFRELTTIVVGRRAPRARIQALSRKVHVLVAPENRGRINLKWLLRKLGNDGITSILVEGGGEVNASFLFEGLAQRVAFFYAAKVLGDRNGIKAVGGEGARRAGDLLKISHPEFQRFDADVFMTGLVSP